MELYYARQMQLKEVGRQGQLDLAAAKCLIIGAGGLGNPVALYLAGAGIGAIGICDQDLVAMNNLHRQIFFKVQDIGKNKAEVLAAEARALNPHIQVRAYPEYLNESNCRDLFSHYDLILDCSDNFRAKFLANDAAFFLQKPLVRASIFHFEGQLQFYDPKRNDPCLRCMWPKQPQEGCVGSCAETGVLGPLAGFFGMLQAMEALKYFLKLSILSSGAVLFYDMIGMKQQIIQANRAPDCSLCGKSPTIRSFPETSHWEINASKISLDVFTCVDIREAHEVARQPLSSCPFIHLPLSKFQENSLNRTKKYLIFCQKGIRSHSLVSLLRKKGFENVFSLQGGIDALH